MKRERTGFTLVEILVAIAVFSVFVLTLSRLMLGGMQTFRKSEALTSLRQDLRDALDLISADFRQNNVNVVSPIYAEGYTPVLNLTFQRYRNVGGTVQTDLVTYTIDPTTNRLTRTSSLDGTTVLVAENVLVGENLGETTSPSLYKSYFKWVKNPSSGFNDSQYGVLEIKLTGTKQDQVLSLSTRVAQRLSFAGGTSPRATVVTPSDVARPVPRAWRRLNHDAPPGIKGATEERR